MVSVVLILKDAIPGWFTAWKVMRLNNKPGKINPDFKVE
jgi:hypothetical protein